jgi:hypothetical protein
VEVALRVLKGGAEPAADRAASRARRSSGRRGAEDAQPIVLRDLHDADGTGTGGRHRRPEARRAAVRGVLKSSVIPDEPVTYHGVIARSPR